MGSRNYVMTYNNPELNAHTLIKRLKKVAKYFVFQLEKGSKGIEHFQGYIELLAPQRISALNRLTRKKGIHWDKRKGTRDQARSYCMKEETRLEGPWEYGEWNARSQGRRMDLERLASMAREKKPNIEILSELPREYVRYHRAVAAIKHIEADEKPAFRKDLSVVVNYGPPGVGKTKAAYDFDPNLYALPVGKDLWWDNYRGEKTVLLDDFSGQCRLVDLLRILDKYPVQLPIKGSFVWLHAVNIIITSNVHPNYWYDYSKRPELEGALKRRITTLLTWKSLGDFEETPWD